MNELIVFTHTVVTGGTTFSDLLEQYFWQHEVISAKNVADQLTDPRLNTPLKRRNDRDQDILARYNKNSRVKLIRSHHHLGYNRRHLWGDRPVKFITLMREPISRFISHGHYLITDLTILERIAQIQEVDFNHQTTYLSGCNTLCATEKDLEIAKAHLNQYDFIGITERYQESVELFTKILGLPYIGWKYNKYRVTKKKNFIPQEVKDRIRELSYLDVELYNYGLQIFEQKLEQYKNVPLIPPTKLDKISCFLRGLDRDRAKVIRYARGKLRANINQQNRLEDYLIN